MDPFSPLEESAKENVKKIQSDMMSVFESTVYESRKHVVGDREKNQSKWETITSGRVFSGIEVSSPLYFLFRAKSNVFLIVKILLV